MEAAGLAQAIITVWGSASDSETEPFAGAQCVLPDTVTEGSFDPNEGAEGAASGFAAFAGWAVLTGAAVAYQLL
jgi:hypothetical protein